MIWIVHGDLGCSVETLPILILTIFPILTILTKLVEVLVSSPSPVAPLGAKGMGEGGGGGIHCIGAAIQDALRAAGGAIVYTSCNPPHRVWSMLQDPAATRANVEVVSK